MRGKLKWKYLAVAVFIRCVARVASRRLPAISPQAILLQMKKFDLSIPLAILYAVFNFSRFLLSFFHY